MNIGFIGLGRMGYNIAKNISKKYNTNVWNRTFKVTEKHSKKYNTNSFSELKDLYNKSNIIFTCLPTSKEVLNIVNQIEDINNIQYFIDCTSGDYQETIKINEILKKKYIKMLDCPVSGGPEKAELGNLSSMVGGNVEDYENIKEILYTFSNPIYIDKIGSGHAVKSINNLLNVTHLCVASEGLNSLKKLDINIENAINVINKSSGRSLMTMERIPKAILSEKYDYGFSLGLMKKDVDLAMNIIEDKSMFINIQNLVDKGVKDFGYNSDYTEVTKNIFKNS